VCAVFHVGQIFIIVDCFLTVQYMKCQWNVNLKPEILPSVGYWLDCRWFFNKENEVELFWRFWL